MSLLDALPSREVNATTLSGTTVKADTLAAAASEVGNAELANNAASGAKVSSEYGPCFAGSPAAPGRFCQAGSGQTGGGSNGWFPFGKEFLAAPDVVCVQNFQAAGVTFFVPGGSLNAGSFYVESSAASSGFRYFAAGSGR